MALISTIISDAFREGNILPLGVAPTSAQSTEALRLLQGLINSIYGGDAGERLIDWPLGNYGLASPEHAVDYTSQYIDQPTINRRMVAVNEAAMTVYWTQFPQDGARMGIADPFSRLAAFPVTIDPNGRTIEGATSLVLNTNGLFREWFYRADLGQWVRITDLLESDQLPFPSMFDNFFTVLLAMRINPRYGREMDVQSVDILRQARQQFVARYVQSQPLLIDDSISWPFMSTQSYDTQREFSSNQAFDQGSYFWGW